METLDEKLLIHENTAEIARIRGEIESRAALLNEILNHGVGKDELPKITASKSTIDEFIFQAQLKINKVLLEQYKAGKKNLKEEYELPQNLQTLSDLLQGWHSYPGGRHFDKYQHLVFTDSWKVDTAELESFFIKSNLKVFVESELLAEWKDVQRLCEISMRYEMPVVEIKNSAFLNKRIEPYGRNLFRPRWTYWTNK